MPGSEREVKVELKMPESLFDCYETAYISRIHFEVKSRVQNQQVVTGQIAALNYLTEEVRKAKVCCEGTSNLKSECVTCAWTEEAAVAFLQVEGFDQVAEIETNGQILSEPDCVCESEPVDNYQQSCVGTNCVEKQVGVGDFEIYQNTYSIDTLYQELRRIASYFDSLGIAFYAGITDNRMFCAEGGSTAFKSQTGNKDMVHFQTQYDAAQVAFWFHFAEVNGEERIHIRQKGFEGEVLDCCCELIPGDCRGNPFSICEGLLENVAHYEAVCGGKPLHINSFEYSGKKGQIVIGTDGNGHQLLNDYKISKKKINGSPVEIEGIYIGTDEVSPSNYVWKTTSNDTDFKVKTGKVYIETDQLPDKNSSFGNVNGKVLVNLQPNVFDIDQVTSEDEHSEIPEGKVKVFYNKDETNPHAANGEPNWFFYWRDEHPNQQIEVPIWDPSVSNSIKYEIKGINFWKSIEMPVYNPAEPSSPEIESFDIEVLFNKQGNYKWFANRPQPLPEDPKLLLGTASQRPLALMPVDVSDLNKGRFANNYEFIINMGEGCANLCAHSYTIVKDANGDFVSVLVNNSTDPNLPSWMTGGTGYTGIDCFMQVIVHEYEHIKIYRENWPNGYLDVDTNADGFNDYDTDGDGYSDAFEDEIGEPFDKNEATPYADGLGTAGYDYEENRCRRLEDAFQSGQLNDVDWSYDLLNEYQGKQW